MQNYLNRYLAASRSAELFKYDRGYVSAARSVAADTFSDDYSTGVSSASGARA